MALGTDIPLDIMTKGLTDSEDRLARTLIERYAQKLIRVAPNLVACRVAVERPMRYQDTGNPYRVRVRATAPGHAEVVVVKDVGQHGMHDPLQTVLKDAFRVAARSLESRLEMMRGNVKRHEPDVVLDEDIQPAIGFVLRLNRELGYGFLRTDDGRELYFHENAVLDGFGELRVGAAVRFEAEQGDDGPQVTSLRVVSQHGPLQEPFGVIEDPEGWKRDET